MNSIKFPFIFFLALLSHQSKAGEPFFLNLVELWPQHETVADLTQAIEHGNSEEVYSLTFNSEWSATTHPDMFPPGPHFSGLVGGNHHGNFAFWAEGALASPGVKSMAETGSKFPLIDEVNTAIGLGLAGEVISGNGIGLSPGQVGHTLTVTREFPRVSIVSMIAPSPDWFVGVAGLPLFQNGDWVDELVVSLYPYDAGTDDGPSYVSPNMPATTPLPIFEIEGAPFLNGLTVPPIGTFTFTRVTPD